MLGGELQQGAPSWFRRGGPPQAFRLLLSLLFLLISAERCQGFTSLEHQWELAVQTSGRLKEIQQLYQQQQQQQQQEQQVQGYQQQLQQLK
ncbi:hypothetical protein Emag_006792 [Eimeria magna]